MQRGQPEQQVDYEAWNQALAEYFYGPAAAHRPAYLCVDTDSLRKIAPRLGVAPSEAEESFVQAVRSWMPRRRPFSGFLWAARQWRRQVQTDPTLPPPFVGLLGALVLAASRMHPDPALQIGSHNYYHRLGEVLGLELRQLPDPVTHLWNNLNEWLERNNGAFGQPTAQWHGEWFRHIVRPMSQCLLRQTDREKLPDFFRWAGLPPHEEIDTDSLVASLQRWVRRTTCRFSDQGKAVLRDESLVRRAAAIAGLELRLWDGLSIDVHGRRRATIDLRLKVFDRGYRFQCDLYPRAPDGVPDGPYRKGDHVVELHRLQGLPWFQPLSSDLAHRALEQGLVLTGEACALAFLPGNVIPLGGKSDLGGWLSCDRVNLGETYAVLCRHEHSAAVEEYLQQYAKEGWRRAPGNEGLPPSWNCILDVQVIEIAQRAEVPEALDCLVPLVYPGIQFRGGLKLDTGTWLCGGEPEVIIATAEEIEVTVEVDERQVAHLPFGSGVVDLPGLGLGPGEHEIRAGIRRRRFELRAGRTDRVARSQGMSLGHTFHREGRHLVPVSLFPTPADQQSLAQEGTVAIEGARLWGVPDEPAYWRTSRVVLRGGCRYYVILGRQPGEIAKYTVQCEYPYWFVRQLGLLWGQMTVEVPFNAQWVIGVGPKRRKRLCPIGIPAPAEGTVADIDQLAEWLRWARKGYRAVGGTGAWRDVWETYRAVASALLEDQR